MRARTTTPTTDDGRFIACRTGFYDPAVFEPNREMTFTGRIEAYDTRKIGGFDYRFPRVAADVVYLWPIRERVDVLTVPGAVAVVGLLVSKRRRDSSLRLDASARGVVWFPCRAAEAASCPPRRERAAIHGRALVNHTTPRTEAHLDLVSAASVVRQCRFRGRHVARRPSERGTSADESYFGVPKRPNCAPASRCRCSWNTVCPPLALQLITTR